MFARTQELHWTTHSRAKMRFYGLSEQRVKRVMHSPKRIEEGIAPKTIAYMQQAGSAQHPYEIWVMVQHAKSAPPPKRSGPLRRNFSEASNANACPTEGHSGAAPMRIRQKPNVMKVISAWRYPGKTKPGEPLPTDVLRELRAMV